MPLTKLMDVLFFKRLWLSQIARLEDRFEGALGLRERQPEWKSFYERFMYEAIRSPPAGAPPPPEPSEAQVQAAKLANDLEQAMGRQREKIFVNCWHIADHESFLMWQVYAGGKEDSVCIKSTLRRITASTAEPLSIGVVQYIDFRKAFPDVNWPFLFKRAAFKQESEARIFVHDLTSSASGKYCSVDPNKLFEEIVVSPTAAGWLKETIEKFCSVHASSVSLRTSELNEEPF